ncbi:hypothetical protein L1049_006390 [Liquidambar formosana]|uniref:Trichome birefringence-like N-terminal domain-containing protein n=1 Tax=Liquidambar formosana TaxID=63359 RepID=A0AAP0RH91_LIQFO
MESKKLAFSEQLLSSRRKVVSGFGLGVGVSVIVLAMILFNYSLKAPMIKPMFQGSNSFIANSSIVSWPFSFSSTSPSPSPSSGTTISATSELQNSTDLMERIEKERVMDKTHEANGSEIGKEGNFSVSNGQVVVSENTHLVANFSGKVKNGSFGVEGVRSENKTHEANVVSGNFPVSNGEGVDLEKAHLGNFPDMQKNGSFSGEEGRIIGKTRKGNFSQEDDEFSLSAKKNATAEQTSEGKFTGRDGNKSSPGNDGKVKVTGSNNVGNLSYDGVNNRSPSEEERDSEMKHGGNSAEKNNITISHYDSQFTKLQNSSFEGCDIFYGRWVRDDSKPYYPAGSCPYIDRDFDCHLNRRPDDGFLKWKWQPNECDIPSLNATDFLERLRGKKLVFVGDSLNRNMWESLVCILRHSIRNKKRVYEISGRREFKKKGFYAFRFEDYNCSVDFVSAPFLVRESSFKGKNGTFETLRLDLMDRTTSMYHDADVIVFNTGHWWTHEKTSRGEDYYQEGNTVHPRLKVLEAYKRALTTWARWVDKNIDGRRTQVFFRGYSVTHFRGGQWNSGGQCHREVDPIFNETHLAKYPSKMRALEYVLQEMKTPVLYLNISRLTDYRKDGHPSIYRMKYKTVQQQIAAERSQDCSHWCLPGVPDTWNELLYASLLNAGRGSWRR